jgi:transposase
MEATGVYGLDLAIALSKKDGVEVMVVNPQVSKDFHRAMFVRSKNDKLDCGVLLEFAERMEFRPFIPPSETAYALRAITREIDALKRDCVRAKCRLHAVGSTATSPKIVIRSLEKTIREQTKAIDKLARAAMALIAVDMILERRFELLQTVPGAAEVSATMLIGELAAVPDFLTARQLAAYAGLDPVEHKSGTSVNARKGISRRGNKRLRRALFMVALTAVRVDEHVKAFHEKLIARGKKPIQALVAVMRKLLHSIWGMFRSNTPFDGARFYSLELKNEIITDKA